jgi:hypothetical protein
MMDVYNPMFYFKTWEENRPTCRLSRGRILYTWLMDDLSNASSFVIEAHIDDVVPRLGSLSSDVFIKSVDECRL